jgi:amino acid adenylation domain-containing protein
METQRLRTGAPPSSIGDERVQCLHELFEQQVLRTPYAAAVAARDGALTYGELNARANALARRLRALGARPDVLVGVAAERSAATIVALLAVLKSGGAYVPLDPEHPPQRVRFLLDDARITLVLASTRVASRFAAHGLTVIDPDTTEIAPNGPRGGVYGEDLAYAIYTSGSTGRPKGVLISHRAIVNSTVARSAFGRFSPGAYAMPAPLTFDASAAGIYWTLCSGGRLVLPDDEQSKDPRLLARLIKDERVTHMTAMPSFYRLVLGAGREALRSLRDVSVGGEVMPVQLPREHTALLPWARLYNDYGPTEAAVWTTAHLCDARDQRPTVSIGRPIRNARVHVVDDELRSLPVGEAGELCIAGQGLARGYLNAPALTAQRFVPNPFADGPGERLYRTGDLARYLDDGTLEFLGRTDTQVKVRGFRVELGEVEAALYDHPDVAAAAVAVQVEGEGDARLVAYVVARHGTQVDRDALRSVLARSLPAYMIPDRLELLDELPRTASGKVERAALDRAPRAVHAGPRRLVRDLSEEQVVAMLRELLGDERTGSVPRAERE